MLCQMGAIRKIWWKKFSVGVFVVLGLVGVGVGAGVDTEGIAEKYENAGGSTNTTTAAIIIAYDFAIPLPFRYDLATIP